MSNTTRTTEQQRAILLAYLQTYHRITTLQARTDLDILHPAGRVLELREAGHNIATHWRVGHTPKGKHRVAEYVLLAGGEP